MASKPQLVLAKEEHLLHLWISPAQLRKIADNMEAFNPKLGCSLTVTTLTTDDLKYKIEICKE